MRVQKIINGLKRVTRINVLLTLYVNFRQFGMNGLRKIPIVIEYGSTFICKHRCGIQFELPLQYNMLSVNEGNIIRVNKGGTILLKGIKACFNEKNTVLISPGGVMEIGNNFYANGYAEFNCKKKLQFGNNVLISVHVMFLDTDYHLIYNESGEVINPDREIIIGNNVWISCNVTILKGSYIGDNIIIGAGTIVAKGSLLENNAIYSGNPAKVIKRGVTWKA